jgi:FdhD protein
LKLGKNIIIKKFKAGSFKANTHDTIPAELLLTIFLNNNPVTTISCSPQNLIELATGFLINNGYIEKYSDIDIVRLCEEDLKDNTANNFLAGKIDFFGKASNNYAKKGRQAVFISTACGTIDDFVLNSNIDKITSKVKVNSEVIQKLNLETLNHQKYKKELGGLHSATLFDSNGRFIIIFEDIGRHNCIDKIAGFMLINKIEFSDKIIFTTGRLSLDAIYKICKMTIPVIVTRSSITYSAARLSKKMNLTAIGYARSGRFNIYSYPSRIIK